ncbi:MAG TPA: hypothetical protein VIK55_12470 [Paludibacter sp.]
MKLISLREITTTATSQPEIVQRTGKEQEKIIWAIAEERDLTECAIWLKNAIEVIDESIAQSKLAGDKTIAIEGLRDLFEESLLDVQKLLLADPSRI